MGGIPATRAPLTITRCRNREISHEISLDTLGFLALSGLFIAHVTGNFVTLGAAAALGLGDALSKLLALPVSCLVVFL